MTSPIRTTLVGDYNIDNLMGVLGALRAPGRAAARRGGGLRRPARRAGPHGPSACRDTPLAVVDYAHTPDAIDKVLQALRPLAAQRGRFICGACLAAAATAMPAKRPLMAQAAERGPTAWC